MRNATCILLLAALWGCGEKIAVPEAVGVATSSQYIEQLPWNLTDPTDVMQAGGRIFLVEEAPGTLSKWKTNQQLQFEVTGLGAPVALGIDAGARVVYVGERGNGAIGPGIAWYDQGDLEFLGRVDLTGIVENMSALVVDEEFIYVSDASETAPAVHRLRRVSPGEGNLVPEGMVCDNKGSKESPQFVFDPQGLVIDSEGMLLICDADTTRNWVLRFDPAAPEGDPEGRGRAVVFQSTLCAVEPPQSFILGSGPGCDEVFVPGPSAEPGGLFAPSGIDIDADGLIYVADRGNQRGQRYSALGSFDAFFGDGAGGVDPLGAPLRLTTWLGDTVLNGIQIYIPGARVYVVDRAAGQLRVFEDRRWSQFQ